MTTVPKRPPGGTRVSLPPVLSLVLLACSGPERVDEPQAPATLPKLEFLGQARFPPSYEFQGSRVGGLSGLDCVKNTGFCFAISDDLSVHGAARFYTLWIDLSDGRLEDGDVRFLDVTTLLDEDGEPFAKHTVDPEAIRFDAGSGTLYWSSEGRVDEGVDPFVRQMRVDGSFLRELPLPKKFLPDGVGARGIRQTLGPESLSLLAEEAGVVTAMENALVQDGPATALAHGSLARTLRFDARGAAGLETVYLSDPVTRDSVPPGRFTTAGVVEILAVDRQRDLVLERSFARGAGFAVKIYLADLGSGQDVSGVESLRGIDVEPVEKHLLLDLSELGIELGNLEGLSFGPVLADGSRSVVLVSDDNFRKRQRTQFLAFRLIDAWGEAPGESAGVSAGR